MREALFAFLGRLAVRHPAGVLAAAAVLTLLLGAAAARIEVRTAFKETLSPDDPARQIQEYAEANFPGALTVTVAVEGADRDRMIEVARALDAEFRKSALVRDVYLEEPVDFFVEHGLLYLPVDELRIVEAEFARWEDTAGGLLGDPSTLGLLRAMERVAEGTFRPGESVIQLSGRMFGALLPDGGPGGRPAIETGMLFETDPLRRKAEAQARAIVRDLPLPPSEEKARVSMGAARDMLSLVADVLEQGERFPDAEFEKRTRALRERDWGAMGGVPDRYRFSPDGTMLVLEVAAATDITRLDLAVPFVQELRRCVDTVKVRWADVRIGMTGGPVIFVEETSSLIQNFALITVLGFIGILAVCIIGFERVALPLLSAVPLFCGVVWTGGVHSLVFGALTLMDLVFPVLLLGLGIDYAIHQVSDWSARRRAGQGPEEAMVGTFVSVGPGLLTGALTTAAAFYVLMASRFHAAKTMGFVAGTGVLMALVAMLTVQPALVALWDRRRESSGAAVPDVPFRWLGPVGLGLRRHRYLLLALWMGVTVGLAYYVPQARLDRNAMNVQPRGMEGVAVQDRILASFGTSNEAVVFVAKDLADAERIRHAAERSPTVGWVFSPSQLVPTEQETKRPILEALAARVDAMAPPAPPPEHTYDEAEMAEVKDRVAALKAVAMDLSVLATAFYGEDTETVVGELRDAVNRIDQRATPAAAGRFRNLDRLVAAEVSESLEGLRRMTRSPSVSEEDLPAQIRGRLRGNDGAWLVLVRANGDVWDEAFLDSFIADLDAIGGPKTGLIPLWDRMLDAMLGDLPRVTLYAFLAVAVLVLIDLRSLKATLLALTPLVLGIVWTVGAMAAFDIPFNLNSTLAVPLLVGIGIDYGVHLAHRLRQERKVAPALVHTGKALLLSALTTGIGFGSLLLSVHRGFFGLGLVTTIGIAASLLAAVLVLPVLVAVFDEGSLDPEETG